MSFWTRMRPYMMITPAMIVFMMFFIYPIFYMIYLSLFEWNFVSPTKQFVGFQNYIQLFQDQGFLEVLKNSFIYTILTVLFSITLSLMLAIRLNRPGALYGFVQAAIFSPHIISLVSVAMLWLWLMEPSYGLLNWVLGFFGLPGLEWISHPNTALLSLVLVAVWKGVGFNALVFIAGLQSIPKDIYEAAELDQSKRFTTFYKLTLPMLSPTLFFLIIINMINSFQVFETIDIMTKGGPINSTNTLVYFIYENGFRFFKIGYASAAGVILLVVISILTVIYFRLVAKKVHYR
ncbi:carbohydrate ABC transporter permease [Ammoniphilus sp. 3BR4]|uniref:carbohydrate ABC transporter permease n=1 Tax=Ammoniphilus sp. 3BR4 TaxID=3158265 RepID=UPI0034675D5D